MDEKIIEQLQESAEPTSKPTICCGLDIGTMNIVLSRSDRSDYQITRNVFLPVKEDEISISDLSDINYIKSEEGNIYIIGEDAFRFANIFSKEVSRPMEKGLISPKEVNAIDVLTMIVKNIIGKTKKLDIYCSYSIPSQAIDEGRSVIYHERVFGKILGSLGINNSPVNEAAAIIYSECANEKFSGIGISFGAGMCNIALMYKGVEAAKFSTSRSGDYIDRSVAESLNIIANRVTSVKERLLDLTIDPYQDKKNGRIIEALQFYYDAMINYTIKKMVEEFNKNIDIDVEDSLPIIVSGGTSLPNGFIELFRSVFSKYSFPIKISEIRRASNPMTAVARGLLIKTLSDIKK